MKWNGRRLVVCGELWCFDQRWIQPKNCKPFTWWFMEKLKQQTFCCRQRDVMNGVVYARRVRDEQQPIYLIILQMKETDENHGTRRRWALMDWSTSYGVNLEVWPLTTHVHTVRLRLFDIKIPSILKTGAYVTSVHSHHLCTWKRPLTRKLIIFFGGWLEDKIVTSALVDA